MTTAQRAQLIGIAVLSALAFAAPAGAAGLVVNASSILEYDGSAAAGTMTLSEGTFDFGMGSVPVFVFTSNPAITIFPTPRCAADSGAIKCSKGGILGIVAFGSNTPDVHTVSGTISTSVTLRGSGGNDTLTSGNAVVNNLEGGPGNDTLNGGPGNDAITGGEGADDIDGGAGVNDFLSYEDFGHASGVTVTLGSGAMDDGNAADESNGRRDKIINVEQVGGTAFDDHLVGSPAAEFLGGAGGADNLEGGGGADELHGHGGNDALDGGPGADKLYGFDGDDTLVGGTEGDVLEGDAGFDTADYSASTESEAVSLDDPGTPANDGSADDGAGGAKDNVDTERVLGSPQSDTLSATVAGKTLDGGGGVDTLTAAAAGSTLIGGTGNDILNGGAGPDILRGGLDADQLLGGGGDDNLDGEQGGDQLDGQGGTDTADYSARSEAVTVSVGSGSGDDGSSFDGAAGARDTLVAAEIVAGSPLGDLLIGTPQGDRLEGRGGDDSLRGGLGADNLIGGEGLDVADYGDRSAAVTLTLDSTDNDGEPAENDHFESIEGVRGGTGADTLTGSNGDDLLEGGDGADRLTGLAGVDVLRGQAGDDDMQARDGIAETVDCGDGNDSTLVDDTDILTGCETKIGGAVLVDADGDGVQAGLDCNDADPKIWPGALEIVGNTVDENCDGVKAPFPFLDAGISTNFDARKAFTVITALKILRLPAGTTVRITCKTKKSSQRKRCFKNTTKSFAKQTQGTSFGTLVRKRKLPVGTVVTIVVSAPNTIGKKLVITTRSNKAPVRKSTCLDPGGKTVSC